MEEVAVQVPSRTSRLEKPATLYQFRALFLKNLSLQKRQKCTICCQVVIPLLIMILIGGLNLLFQNLLRDANRSAGTTEPPGTPQQPFIFSSPSKGDALAYLYFENAPPPNLPLGICDINGVRTDFFQYVYQYTETINNTNNNPFFQYYWDQPEVYLPFFIESSIADVDKRILAEVDYQNSFPFTRKWEASFQHSFPAGVIQMHRLQNSSNNLQLDFTAMTQRQSYNGGVFWAWTVNTITNGFLKTSINSMYDIYPSVLEFPRYSYVIDPSSFLTTYLFPFAFSLLLPMFVYDIVYEKQEKLREMMKMMGLKMSNYWIIMFLYDFIIYLIQFFVCLFICLAFQLNFFLKTNFGIIILLFLGWGLTLVALGFFLSVLFSKTRTAIILSYIFVIIFYLVGVVSVNFKYSKTTGYKIVPPFAFYQGISVIGNSCGVGACPTSFNKELQDSVVILWLEAPLIILLALYLDQVLPKEFGVRKQPFFFLKAPYKMLKKRFFPKESFSDEIYKQAIEKEDADVAEERKRVLGGLNADDYPVLITNLHKTYKTFGQPRKVALVDLCLSIPKGECFGLLGPNGAGKTTTISILTGLYEATSGHAKVGGFDIREDMDQIHRIIGVCPQFDTLWENLTVEETLLFYTRLKGIFGKRANESVETSLRQVALTDAKQKLVKELSGGMKRRLSVAVSLVGDPSVIFFDEPTTGLDVGTRRNLWDVLLEVKKGRVIILTTHSMEEADVLCSRIGIVSKGCLQCLGSNGYLKTKFGDGYILKISYNAEESERVKGFIQSILPKAKETESLAGNSTFQIPLEGFSVSQLLADLEKSKDTSGITDWGLSQTSLEDVFLTIARRDEEKK